MHLAQAMTHVDVIVIDDHDFMTAQVRFLNQIGFAVGGLPLEVTLV